MRLLAYRRRVVLCHHAKAPSRGVDRGRGDGRAGGDGVRSLRLGHRPRTLGGSRRLLHHQGALRWREGREEPGRQGKARHQTLGSSQRQGHPARGSGCPRKPPRLAAAWPDSGHRAGFRFAPGGCQHPPRSWLRLRGNPPEAAGSPSASGDFREGQARPLNATGRWIVERTNSWQNAHKKLVWCTERRARVVDFWMAFSNVVIIVGRLVREAWKRYRWDGRPLRRP